MSYYEGDRRPNFASPRAGDRFAEVARAVRRQAGHNARVTVETTAANRRSEREQDPAARLYVEETQPNLERIRLRKQERVERPIVYVTNARPSSRQRRRNSFPTKTRYRSPAFRPPAPLSALKHDAEVVVEVPAAIEDSDGYLEDLDFKIPKATKAVHFSDDVGFIIPDHGSNESQQKPPPPSKSSFTGQMTELTISRSRWDGNIFERGDLGAELETMTVGPETEDKHPTQLMRWCHLHRSAMNFEEFIAASQSVLRLPEKEQRDVVKLLRDVQKKFEKQRHHGRELEPNCVSDIFYNDSTGTSRQTESVIFV